MLLSTNTASFIAHHILLSDNSTNTGRYLCLNFAQLTLLLISRHGTLLIALMLIAHPTGFLLLQVPVLSSGSATLLTLESASILLITRCWMLPRLTTIKLNHRATSCLLIAQNGLGLAHKTSVSLDTSPRCLTLWSRSTCQVLSRLVCLYLGCQNLSRTVVRIYKVVRCLKLDLSSAKMELLETRVAQTSALHEGLAVFD